MLKDSWTQAIKQNKQKEILRAVRGLFVDKRITVSFLTALLEVSSSSAGRKLAHMVKIRAEVRRRVRELNLEELEAALTLLTTLRNGRELAALVLGSPLDEIGPEPEKLITKLLIIFGHQQTILRKGAALPSAGWALILLLQAACRQVGHTWTNALRHAWADSNNQFLRLFVHRMAVSGFGYNIIPLSQIQQPLDATEINGTSVLYNIPAPDELVDWLSFNLRRIAREISKKEEGLIRLVQDFRSHRDEYGSSYETMWLEMMLTPRWALREGSLDRVELAIPELSESGSKSMRFTPLEPFPKFRMNLYRETPDGEKQEIEAELEPSDLQMINLGGQDIDDIRTWTDRLYSFLAVQAVWRIVMGHDASESEAQSQRVGSRMVSGIVRPRFRRLPEGYKASLEARARALETFRKEPLPGFTFVRQYVFGVENHFTEPLFSVTGMQLLP